MRERISGLKFVSVIVPVFNDPVGIETVLRALLVQSYPPDRYDVIIADNGSTDETPQIVARIQKQNPALIHLVVENEIRSSYAARNRGICAAKGEILAFTDADCVPVPHWIEAGVASLQHDLAACGGGRIEFTYKSELPSVFEYFDSTRKLNQQSYVETSGFAATANFFARRHLFDRYGLFRDDLVSGGDYEFGRRVTGQGEKMIYMSDALVCHPARSTFRAIYTKSKRVALGQSQLERLGLLAQGERPLRRLPVDWSWSVDSRWASSLSAWKKIQLIFLQKFFRSLNLLIRIRRRVDGPKP